LQHKQTQHTRKEETLEKEIENWAIQRTKIL